MRNSLLNSTLAKWRQVNKITIILLWIMKGWKTVSKANPHQKNPRAWDTEASWVILLSIDVGANAGGGLVVVSCSVHEL